MAAEHDPSSSGPGGAGMTPREKAHFKFAMILIFACIVGLPTLGAIWILLMQWGVLARPQ